MKEKDLLIKLLDALHEDGGTLAAVSGLEQSVEHGIHRIGELKRQFGELARAAGFCQRGEWVPVSEATPPHCVSVIIWITGGTLHHGEDYQDIGIYNSRTGKFQVNNGDDDEEVPVSHWHPMKTGPNGEA